MPRTKRTEDRALGSIMANIRGAGPSGSYDPTAYRALLEQASEKTELPTVRADPGQSPTEDVAEAEAHRGRS
jgi:hypothetical protein